MFSPIYFSSFPPPRAARVVPAMKRAAVFDHRRQHNTAHSKKQHTTTTTTASRCDPTNVTNAAAASRSDPTNVTNGVVKIIESRQTSPRVFLGVATRLVLFPRRARTRLVPESSARSLASCIRRSSIPEQLYFKGMFETSFFLLFC